MPRPDLRAENGTHYIGESRRGEPILRIKRECPCEREECPFDGRTEFRVEPDMVCRTCGNTLHPNPVEYRLNGEWHVAHNLVCPYCAMTMGCLD
jgi:hypothetical protein